MLFRTKLLSSPKGVSVVVFQVVELVYFYKIDNAKYGTDDRYETYACMAKMLIDAHTHTRGPIKGHDTSERAKPRLFFPKIRLVAGVILPPYPRRKKEYACFLLMLMLMQSNNHHQITCRHPIHHLNKAQHAFLLFNLRSPLFSKQFLDCAQSFSCSIPDK